MLSWPTAHLTASVPKYIQVSLEHLALPLQGKTCKRSLLNDFERKSF